jgi:hypothetical protein
MDRNFRKLALEQLQKLAGPLTDAVEKAFPSSGGEKKYSQLKVSLSGPPGCSSVFWPGPQVIQPDGSVNFIIWFRGGNTKALAQANSNAILITADIMSVNIPKDPAASAAFKAKWGLPPDATGMGGMAAGLVYGNAAFVNNAVSSVMNQLKQQLNRNDLKVGKVAFVGWSGGYDPIRRILKDKNNLATPIKNNLDSVVLLDGMHSSKTNGNVNPNDMKEWVEWAKEAMKDPSKKFYIAHSAIPTDYGSTTETSNYLLQTLGLQRNKANENIGGVNIASKAGQGGLQVFQAFDNSKVPLDSLKKQHVDVLNMGGDILKNIFNS